MHRCPKCLNEIREESIFDSLNDNILEMSVFNFGILVKRRTLLKALIFVLACFACGYFWQQQNSDLGRLAKILEHRKPNLDLTWQKYLEECGP